MLIYPLFKNMLEQPHLLIAGTTGSGKSVLINNLIYTALQDGPDRVQLLLIDPKYVNLQKWRDCPHTVAHCTKQSEIVRALRWARHETDNRLKWLASRKLENMPPGFDLYVIIDELMDIMTTYPKQAKTDIQYLAQVGRAARVHVIAATQTPIREIIPTALKCNFDARAGLRTRSAQDSRNILGVNGLETLPKYGQCVYMSPDEFTLYNIPKISDADLYSVINHWTK